MRKYAKILGVYLLIVALQISSMSSGLVIYAENIGNDVTSQVASQFIEAVDIKEKVSTDPITGSNVGNSLEGQTDIDKDTQFYLSYDFIVPNTHSIQEGDFIIYDVPKEITLPIGGSSFPTQLSNLLTEDGETIAEAFLEQGNKIKLVFTDNVETVSNVGGTFVIDGGFNQTEIKTDGSITVIDFSIPNTTLELTIKADAGVVNEMVTPIIANAIVTSDSATLQIEGALASGMDIKWEVTVNKEQGQVENAVVVYTIPSSQELDVATILVNGVAATPGNVSNTDGILRLTLGDISTQQKITFVTSLTENELLTALEEGETSIAVTNNTMLEHGVNKITNADRPKTVTIPLNIFSMSGLRSGNSKLINWKVVVNSDKLALNNVVFESTAPAGLEYVSVGYMGGGQGASHSVTSSNVTVKLGNIIDEATITYTTIIDSSKFHNNSFTSFSNSATLIWDGLTGGGITTNATVDVESNLFIKSGAGYNQSNRVISWAMSINNEYIDLKKPTITDIIPADQKYIEGSAKIVDHQGKAYSGGTFNYDADTSELSYTFSSETISSMYTITFETEVTDFSKFVSQNGTLNNGNFSIKNDATLNFSIKKGQDEPMPHVVSNSATQEIENHIVSKKGISTTYGNKYVDWVVYLNSNAVDLNQLLDVDKFWLIDNLQAGLELDTTSVTLIAYDKAIVVPNSIPANGNDGLGAGRSISLDGTHIKYDATTGEFRFNFPNDTIQTAYKLSFRTYVTESVTSGTDFSSSIHLFGSKAGIPVSFENVYQSSDSRQVSFLEAGSAGYGDLGRFIVKEVDLNNPNNKLSGAKFALYDCFGNKVQEKTAVDGELEFNRIKSDLPYYIKELEEPVGFLLSNDVTLDNHPATFTTTADVVEGAIEVQLNSGTNQKSKELTFNSQGVKGTIQFVKQNESNNPLAGAQFGLFTRGASTSAKPLATAISTSTGIVSFTNVAYGQYDIREISAPAGYLTLTDVVHTVNITAADHGSTIMLADVKNELIRSNIEFVKNNEKHQPLAGATFGLYNNLNVEIQRVTTGTDGKVLFMNVGEGNYTIKEVSPPSGYERIDGVIYNVTITGDDQNKTKQLNPVTNIPIKPTPEPTPTPGDNGETTTEPAPVEPKPEQPEPIPVEPEPTPTEPTRPVPMPEEPKPTIAFSDISSNWAKDMIEDIAARGIIKGYPDGTFRPNEPIKREHVAVMFARALELTAKREVVSFSDVPMSHPYYEAITRLQQAGIIEGSYGAFNPAESLTRAQLAKILVLAFGLTPGGVSAFQDVPITHWSYNYIAALEDSGIALGDNGNFRPGEPVTRAQFVAFLYRALNL